MMRAVIVVDMQQDFMPGGPVPVPGADLLIPVINSILEEAASMHHAIVYTQDWHPQDHVSFCTTHPGHIPGDKISVPLAGGTATVTLFPPHCVAGSQGAQLAPGLNATWLQPPAGDFQASSEAAGQGVPCCLIRKGILPDLESFSAFYDMARRQSTGLSEWLRGRNVRSVALVGVATEFCVRLTALDALQEGGWEVVVVADGVGAVDTAAGSAALEEVQRQGGKVMTWRQYCVSLGSS